MEFINLGIVTDYTLLRSIIKIDNLISFAISNNISTLGILNDNLYSTMEFYTKCKKNNIKPNKLVLMELCSRLNLDDNQTKNLLCINDLNCSKFSPRSPMPSTESKPSVFLKIRITIFSP